MFCTKCGGVIYFDLEGIAHCVCCESMKDLCSACGGKGYREIRNQMETCGLCSGTGWDSVISEMVDAGEARR